MTPDDEQPSDADAVPSVRSVPIDLSGYQIPSGWDPLRTYYSEDAEPAVYLDGAGGLTQDRSRAVLPSEIVSEPVGSTADPYRPSGDSTFSDLNGFYVGLATEPKRKEATPMRSARATAVPETRSLPVLQPTNAFAIVALVCALIGGSFLAIVFGHVALSQIRRTGERGEGMAHAALVIGYLALVASVVILIVSLVAAANAAHY